MVQNKNKIINRNKRINNNVRHNGLKINISVTLIDGSLPANVQMKRIVDTKIRQLLSDLYSL